MTLTPDEFTGRRYGIYEVLCRLAVGGMAEIFLGFARSGISPGRPVVIKRILSENNDEASVDQFLEEARVTARLHGLHIARVVDLLNVNEEIILVIDFIRGANLDEIYESFEYVGQKIPTGLVAAMIRDAARGLVEAHGWVNDEGQKAPIIHRDMTPRNVMLGFDGIGRVLDFGIARVSGTQRRTAAGMVRGTSAYMSPEQAIGSDVDPRSDIFSLGIVFFELLTGTRLFRRASPADEMKAVYQEPIPAPSSLNPAVPKAFDELIAKMLTRNLAGRMATAQQVVDELTRIAGSEIWTREQCGSEMKGRFSMRLAAIIAAVQRIPKHALGTDRERKAMPSPAERAGDATLLMTDYEKSDLATPLASPAAMKNAGPSPKPLPSSPSASARPTQVGEPDETKKVDAIQLPDELLPRPAPTTQPVKNPELGAATLPPSVLLSASAQSLNPVGPTKPSSKPREGKRPKKSTPRWPIAVAMGVALLVGASVGKVSSMMSQTPPLAQLSVVSDRPALLIWKKKTLGPTPITVMLPEGHYELKLKEPTSGNGHMLSVDLLESQPFTAEVRLDALPKAP